MELDENPERLMHRSETDGRSNVWVFFLVAALWIVSIILYVPWMP